MINAWPQITMIKGYHTNAIHSTTRLYGIVLHSTLNINPIIKKQQLQYYKPNFWYASLNTVARLEVSYAIELDSVHPLYHLKTLVWHVLFKVPVFFLASYLKETVQRH